MEKMRATVFHSPHHIALDEVPRPRARAGEAIIRITLTTIYGTDLHIVRGEYPVKPGLVIGHEPVGVIEELGDGVAGYHTGDRVLVGAITPCGQCRACLSGQWSQCGHGTDYEALGGWRFGNTINGAQAEYLRVPFAQANLAVIPPPLRDEQVVLLADIASTGFSGAESAEIRFGDTVVVFAQGPIGLSATVGARLMGASLIIGVDGDPTRLSMAKRLGAGCGVGLPRDRCRRGGQTAHRRWRRCRHRSAGHARDIRKGAALPSPGRHLIQPRRVHRQIADSLRCFCRRDRRLPHHHNLMSRRKRTYAPAHGTGASRTDRS